MTHIIKQFSIVSANKSAISAWVLRRAPKPCHHAIPSTQSSAKRRLSAPVIQSPSSVIKSLAFTAAAASTILSVMFNDSLIIHSVARCQKSEYHIYIFYICTCVYIIYLYTLWFYIHIMSDITTHCWLHPGVIVSAIAPTTCNMAEIFVNILTRKDSKFPTTKSLSKGRDATKFMIYLATFGH